MPNKSATFQALFCLCFLNNRFVVRSGLSRNGVAFLQICAILKIVNTIFSLILVGVALIIGGLYFSAWIYLQPEPTF